MKPITEATSGQPRWTQTIVSSVAVSLSFLCFSNHGNAEVVTTHASLSANFAAHYPIGYLGADTFFVEGDSGIRMAHSFDLTVAGAPWIHDTGELGGEIHGAGDQLFRLYAGSTSSSSGGYDPHSEAFITASWRDVTYVTGLAPASIRLQFQIDGSLYARRNEAEFTPYDFAGAMLATRMFSELVDPNDPYIHAFWNYSRMFERIGSAQYELTQTVANSDAIVTKAFGFDSDTGPSGLWTVTYDVPYSQAYGGYAWSFWAAVGTSTANGAAISSFGHTFRLTDILDSSGNSIASSSSFDSGLVLVSAVPEIDPATGGSALSLVAGVLAMIEQRRRRATIVA